MNLPTIELASLPSLETMTGIFGSLSHFSTSYTDDRLVILMVYLYEQSNGLALLGL
ncbi:hypothetical protein [Tsuneonella mangrovi]|uniref:hypothetical protein n=1 Tax=Tsuneonella mangrovi TaxID=1982042 RepID=UPI001470C496|nr:hypothetical protein [Tsuneonella mangrovi]